MRLHWYSALAETGLEHVEFHQLICFPHVPLTILSSTFKVQVFRLIKLFVTRALRMLLKIVRRCQWSQTRIMMLRLSLVHSTAF